MLEERVDTSTNADRQYVWGTRYVDDLILRDRDTNADGTLDERLFALQDVQCTWTPDTITREEPYLGVLMRFYTKEIAERGAGRDWDAAVNKYGKYLSANRDKIHHTFHSLAHLNLHDHYINNVLELGDYLFLDIGYYVVVFRSCRNKDLKRIIDEIHDDTECWGWSELSPGSTGFTVISVITTSDFIEFSIEAKELCCYNKHSKQWIIGESPFTNQ